ncbi:MAG: ATP-dependent DNA ligase [Nocardioides sp.]
MLLSELVAVSAEVAATRARKAKVAALARLLSDVPPGEVALVVTYLAGSLRQRRTGVGWRSVTALPEPATEPTLTVIEVDAAFAELAGLSGPGSQGQRTARLAELLGRASADEQRWLRGAITGEVRQGALDALVQEAVAAAAGVPVPAVRRAAMLAGGTPPAAEAAFAGGEPALVEIGLTVGRPVLPMLASSAPDVAGALAKAGGAVAVDRKLDGIRVQVHRDSDEVVVATRSLDDITHRLPEVVAVARALPAERFVLDGEALALDDHGRPLAFQDTASRTAQEAGVAITPYFFDLLHLDGRDLLDEPLSARLAALDALVPGGAPGALGRPPRRGRRAQAFLTDTLAAGHEGVVKSLPRRTTPAGARRRLGEGHRWNAHPRPGRARRRVGQRAAPGLGFLEHPPRRT